MQSQSKSQVFFVCLLFRSKQIESKILAEMKSLEYQNTLKKHKVGELAPLGINQQHSIQYGIRIKID